MCYLWGPSCGLGGAPWASVIGWFPICPKIHAHPKLSALTTRCNPFLCRGKEWLEALTPLLLWVQEWDQHSGTLTKTLTTQWTLALPVLCEGLLQPLSEFYLCLASLKQLCNFVYVMIYIIQ
jgi:hypothetical protein